MATAPFQLWMDLTTISSAVRSSGTVTVTTAAPHGITTGAYIQMENATGTAGTSMNGVYSVTATSGSAFTYTSSGTAGTGVTGSACISYDLLNPLINYSGSAKDSALYVPTDSLIFSISGDGSGASSSVQVFQDDTPADGPWFNLVPDQARMRLVQANTGSTPAADKSDLFFTALISNISSRLNGAGQGTISDVSLQDMTSLLDRVFVYSYGKQNRLIARSGLVRSGGTTTVTTNIAHALPVGGTVTISAAGGGDDESFNIVDTTYTIIAPNTFTYGQPTGNDATGNAAISISAGTYYDDFQIQYTVPSGSNVPTGALIVVEGVTATTANGAALANGVFQGWSTAGSNTIIVTTDGSISGETFSTTSAVLYTQGIVTPKGTMGTYALTLASGKTEAELVNQALSAVNDYKSADFPFQRSFNTAATAFVSASTTLKNKEAVEIETQGLRGVLDTIVEIFQGIDGRPRRYFVDAAGNLDYKSVASTDQPTYATAPYKIITTGTQNPNTTTAAATLIPHNLSIGYDYGSTKSGIPLANAGTVYQPAVSTYRDYGYAERRNAPLFDDVIPEAVTATKNSSNSYRYGNSFFLQAHPPLLSGVATFRGAGTVAHNQYGFNAGYAQTGASTFALVKSWAPGQWVNIECAELALTGLYRIEQVDWTLERGSFTQVITIVFSYKPQGTFTRLLASVR